MAIKELNVTTSLEDYLEAIFFLGEKNSYVRVTDIASRLNISKPSVNRAINTLKKKGLINHEHYGSVTLTESGIKAASAVAKRHIMLKGFLMDIIGVDEARAEVEACKIEHILSPETVNKIEEFTASYNQK